MRVLVGRLIALAYLFCVLSPGAALAFGNGPEPCFDEVVAPMAAGYQEIAHHEPAHHAMMAQMQAGDGQNDHHGTRMHRHATVHEDAGAPAGHHDHGKMPGACCAALCVVGIAVDLPNLTAPTRMAAGQVFSGEQILVGRAPPLLYRPPIALV